MGLNFDKLDREMRTWRQHLHQYPEFGFEENKTAEFVVEKLKEFGFEDIQTGIGGTGVVASLKKGRGGKTIAFRADMDCLKIEEETNLPYSSKNAGLMHACGHDGHTTMLLGAAHVATTLDFEGTIRFVFQPAEEWGQGMNAMIADGLGTDIAFDEIYGLHNMPGLPVGSFAIRPGPFMGAEDGFEIKVTGAGGHASRPHECRDAILCASSIVTELQSIVSRAIDPSELAVVSVTGISGSNIKNAIASEAVIEGDCRHFNNAVSERIETSLKRIAKGVADAHLCDVEVAYERVFVPLINEEKATVAAITAARKIFGDDKVNPNAAKMGAAEDFARILEYAPGAFGNIGNGDSATLHSPKYDFNDDALMHGVKWYAELIRARLSAE